jgi:hypothetical protein
MGAFENQDRDLQTEKLRQAVLHLDKGILQRPHIPGGTTYRQVRSSHISRATNEEEQEQRL